MQSLILQENHVIMSNFEAIKYFFVGFQCKCKTLKCILLKISLFLFSTVNCSNMTKKIKLATWSWFENFSTSWDYKSVSKSEFKKCQLWHGPIFPQSRRTYDHTGWWNWKLDLHGVNNILDIRYNMYNSQQVPYNQYAFL